MQQLSGLDAFFIHAEHASNPMHIGPVMIYDPATSKSGAANFKDIVATFANRLHLSSIFRRRMVTVPGKLDKPYWIEDPDFTLSEHIHRHTLSAPGNWAQFCVELADLHAQHLDRRRPLWEAHIIEGLDKLEGLPPGCFAIYLKTHHATQDGATGVEIVEAIHDLEPEAAQHRHKDAWKPEPQPGAMGLLRKALGNNLRQPAKLLGVAGRALPALRHWMVDSKALPRRSLLLKERTRFNGAISPRRAVGFICVELGQLKRVSAAVPGAKLNDVGLAIVSGAMRRYLDSKGELPQNSLISGVPVNARQREHRGTGGNMVSAMRVSLCSDRDDPLERLRGIHQDSTMGKSAQDIIGADLLTDLTECLPPYLVAWGSSALLASGLMAKMDPAFHTLVSNVPGPKMPLYLCDAQMLMIVGLGPCIDNIGLFHTISSYCDVVTVAFQACGKMLPDPDFYEVCLQESFDELLAATSPGK